jgi:hypothetical protein
MASARVRLPRAGTIHVNYRDPPLYSDTESSDEETEEPIASPRKADNIFTPVQGRSRPQPVQETVYAETVVFSEAQWKEIDAKCISYIDAMLMYCTTEQIEIIRRDGFFKVRFWYYKPLVLSFL